MGMDDAQIRLSDADRTAAIERLGSAMTRGYISIGEFDERCGIIAKAVYRSDLDAAFAELPEPRSTAWLEPLPKESVVPQAPRSITPPPENQAKVHRDGQNIRAGIMAITALVGAFLADYTADVSILLIPIMAVMLYLFKIGPASWYAPSPRQLYRAQLREIQAAEQRKALERSAARKNQVGDITDNALDLLNNSLENRLKKRRRR